MNFEKWHKQNNPGYSKRGPLWPVGEEAFSAGFKAGLEARQAASELINLNSCHTNDQNFNKSIGHKNCERCEKN
ncbi:hypothetical protein [Desulfobacula phenolica]|uniref:Uncharacterized protein n=1 Tax=Desulfobacula phenolica TaxID=90732 RepID=A0A1H2J9N5_9BACT|nr:hypothetical protein [Desulfobacula phenolica]SDU53130.1 hypothetical protein SAMN04487931_11181 [Desulfobacula phenolica]